MRQYRLAGDQDVRHDGNNKGSGINTEHHYKKSVKLRLDGPPDCSVQVDSDSTEGVEPVSPSASRSTPTLDKKCEHTCPARLNQL